MSIRCITRPPSILPSKLASLGSTIATISEVDALTGFPGGGVPANVAVATAGLPGACLRFLLVLVIRFNHPSHQRRFRLKCAYLARRLKPAIIRVFNL